LEWGLELEWKPNGGWDVGVNAVETPRENWVLSYLISGFP